ncbi:hypothetical protein L7F22_027488 [Adiantum nelumboides]|nr:hypothetical protein [Adiantum nelumboides]
MQDGDDSRNQHASVGEEEECEDELLEAEGPILHDSDDEGDWSNVSFPTCKNKMEEYPIVTKFCYTTAEEIHEEYGLNMKGVLPIDLGDDDLPNEEWMMVFKKSYQKGAKIYLNHMHARLLKDCRFLFHKVYQAPPSCGEITAKFARCFAYERCHAATKPPTSHKVAWARFGESVLNMCASHPGGLERKVETWRRANGASHGDLGSSIKKPRLTQSGSNLCTENNDYLKLSKFMDCLHEDVRDKVEVDSPTTYADAVAYARGRTKKLLKKRRVSQVVQEEPRVLWLQRDGAISMPKMPTKEVPIVKEPFESMDEVENTKIFLGSAQGQSVRFAHKAEEISDLETEEEVEVDSSSSMDTHTSWETKSFYSKYETVDILHVDEVVKESVLEEQDKVPGDVLDTGYVKESLPTNKDM